MELFLWVRSCHSCGVTARSERRRRAKIPKASPSHSPHSFTAPLPKVSLREWSRWLHRLDMASNYYFNQWWPLNTRKNCKGVLSAKQFDGQDLNHLTQLWKKWKSHHFFKTQTFFKNIFQTRNATDVNSSNMKDRGDDHVTSKKGLWSVQLWLWVSCSITVKMIVSW